MTEATATFRKPFAEGLAALRLRFGDLVPTVRWDDIPQAAHDRAFMVAGAMKADLLADLAAAVDRIRSEGITFEAFKADFLAIAEKHGWKGWTGQGTEKGERWRARVIYRTNMLTSRAAGRRAQLIDGEYPFWVYRHSGAEHPRLHHLEWDGLALPPDHSFWVTNSPPNGWGCGCEVYGARSQAGIRRVGGDPDKDLPEGWNVRDPQSGMPPGIDRGWDHAPGATVSDTVLVAAQKIEALPALLGARYGQTILPMVDKVWPTWIADTLTRGSHRPGLAGVIEPTILNSLDARGMAPRSSEIMVRPGLLTGPKAERHRRRGDDLSPDDWLVLPAALRNPAAVLLDTRTGNILYVVRAGKGQSQFAVSIDYWLKSRGGQRQSNVIVSAYRPDGVHLRERIAAGTLSIIMGGI